MLQIDDHPLLDLGVLVSVFPKEIGRTESPPELADSLRLDADVPMQSSDEVRKAVRDLLRHGGYKPTGRGKPASEYLIKAASGPGIGSINLAVDICNIVSLHSGLPISVVDLDLVHKPLRVAIASEKAGYVFNQSGQTIDVSGLLCLFDTDGPCANAVKDSHRTKTHSSTRRTLSLVWGTKKLAGLTDRAVEWYQELLDMHGVELAPRL